MTACCMHSEQPASSTTAVEAGDALDCLSVPGALAEERLHRCAAIGQAGRIAL